MKKIFLLTLVAGLVGCGGSSGDDSSSQPSNPVEPTIPVEPSKPYDPNSITRVDGSLRTDIILSGSTNQAQNVIGLFDKNQKFWFVYTAPHNNNAVAGAMTGDIAIDGNSLASSNSVDHFYGGGENLSTAMNASFDSNELKGSISYNPANQVAFNLKKDSALSGIKARVPDIVGTYKGTSAVVQGVEGASLTVRGDGTLTGSTESKCIFSGKIQPEADTPYFTTSIKFGGSPCLLGNGSYTGITYYDSKTKILYALSTSDTSKADSVLFLGSK